jgi:hypothetical protein
MTLPTSGPLTLAQIRAEFGGTDEFASYYRGGPHVPIGTAAGTGSYQTAPLTPNAGPIQIPTSGGLQFSHFYGTSNGPSDTVVSSPNTSCNQSNYPTGTTNCFIDYQFDGTITHGGGGGGTINHFSGATFWNTLNGSGYDYSSEYEFLVTNVHDSGSTGTYSPTATGAATSFSASAGPNKFVDVVFTVNIVRISDSSVITTFTTGLGLDNT